MGNYCSYCYFSNTCNYVTLKSKKIKKMIVGSIKENTALEKRVSINSRVSKKYYWSWFKGMC